MGDSAEKTTTDRYQWANDEPSGMARACAAAHVDRRSFSGWVETPSMGDDGSVGITCALMLDRTPQRLKPSTRTVTKEQPSFAEWLTPVFAPFNPLKRW